MGPGYLTSVMQGVFYIGEPGTSLNELEYLTPIYVCMVL